MSEEVNGQELLGGERPGVLAPDELARSSAVATGAPVDSGVLDRIPRRPIRLNYLTAMTLGGLVVVLGFLSLLLGLQMTGHLPPPAISNNVCIDDKLRFLRDSSPQVPNVLIVGSSVAWRGIDGAVLAQAGDIRPLNGGFCGLKANQTKFVTDWLIQRYPSSRLVLMLAVPQDFTGCHDTSTEVFDRKQADRYVFDRAWSWGFYFKYFDAVSLLRNARNIAAQRSNRIPLDPLVFTRTGDGPLDTDVSRDNLGYGVMPAFDQTCFDALHTMAAHAAAQGQRFRIVQMPLNAEWSRRFDADGRIRDGFATRLDQVLANTGGERWDLAIQDQLPEAAFTDAIHLRWSAVAGISRLIAQRLLKDRASVVMHTTLGVNGSGALGQEFCCKP